MCIGMQRSLKVQTPEQFPEEIEPVRKMLYPELKKGRPAGKQARIVKDKRKGKFMDRLIINNCEYYLPNDLNKFPNKANLNESFSMLHLNTRSIVNKFDSFYLKFIIQCLLQKQTAYWGGLHQYLYNILTHNTQMVHTPRQNKILI